MAINVDGLPLSKSTNSVFWPVLGEVKSIKDFKNIVFLIGLYHGYGKPKHPDILLKKFVEECQNLNNKICIDNILIDFNVIMVVCDMPAKAFILQIKS